MADTINENKAMTTPPSTEDDLPTPPKSPNISTERKLSAAGSENSTAEEPSASSDSTQKSTTNGVTEAAEDKETIKDEEKAHSSHDGDGEEDEVSEKPKPKALEKDAKKKTKDTGKGGKGAKRKAADSADDGPKATTPAKKPRARKNATTPLKKSKKTSGTSDECDDAPEESSTRKFAAGSWSQEAIDLVGEMIFEGKRNAEISEALKEELGLEFTPKAVENRRYKLKKELEMIEWPEELLDKLVAAAKYVNDSGTKYTATVCKFMCDLTTENKEKYDKVVAASKLKKLLDEKVVEFTEGPLPN